MCSYCLRLFFQGHANHEGHQHLPAQGDPLRLGFTFHVGNLLEATLSEREAEIFCEKFSRPLEFLLHLALRLGVG
jgi:hypothetical protein